MNRPSTDVVYCTDTSDSAHNFCTVNYNSGVMSSHLHTKQCFKAYYPTEHATIAWSYCAIKLKRLTLTVTMLHHHPPNISQSRSVNQSIEARDNNT